MAKSKKDHYKLNAKEMETIYIAPVMYIIAVGVLGFIIAKATPDPLAFPIVAIGIAIIYSIHTHRELMAAHKLKVKKGDSGDEDSNG